MYLSIFESGEPEAEEALSIDPASLYSTFEQVRDGRKQKGKRYPLPLLLTLVRLQQTGRSNDDQWHCGLDQGTTRLAASPIEVAQALSDQFDV